MRKELGKTFLMILWCFSASAQPTPTPILVLGSDHLSQLYKKDNPNTDVLTPGRQKELEEFTLRLTAYRPDLVAVEVLPEKQKEVDSLYALYRQDKLKLNDLEGGRSEVYQLAFRLGKRLNLNRIHCVDAPGGTSQSMLHNGRHIELYQQETVELRKVVGRTYAALQDGSLSLKDFLIFLNRPETYNMIYRLRYMTPARVTEGTFKNPDSSVDTASIDPKYIGAELISLFKKRDYKIYSNLVNAQMAQQPKRMLLIIGAAHVGSLKSIFRDDPAYTVVDAGKYLQP
jgi:hypothetical protein